MGKYGFLAALLVSLSPLGALAEDSDWVSILPTAAQLTTDWTIKFSGKAVGQNPDTTFRLSPEGYLWANNHTAFSRTNFGHLYYTKKKFSYYLVRAEYRFTADKSASGFAEWTNQNNGLMLHSPEPATVNGDFPNSIEVQLLGPKNTNGAGVQPSTPDWPVGHTANMCIAGDQFAVNYNGNTNYTSHCTASTYPNAWKGTQTPWEQEWSEVTVRVLADSMFQHYLKGQKVMEYTKIRNKSNQQAIKEGYVAIQAEGTSTLFRKLQILELIGCMDATKPGYRSYNVKSDDSKCATTGMSAPAASERFALERVGMEVRVRGNDARITGARRIDGGIAEGVTGASTGASAFSPARPGIYLITVKTASGASATVKVPLF